MVVTSRAMLNRLPAGLKIEIVHDLSRRHSLSPCLPRQELLLYKLPGDGKSYLKRIPCSLPSDWPLMPSSYSWPQHSQP